MRILGLKSRSPKARLARARWGTKASKDRKVDYSRHDAIVEGIRKSLSQRELQEVEKTAEKLHAWRDKGCPGDGKRGRPRLYFGMNESALEILMKDLELAKPDFSYGINWGLMYTGREAFRACIRLAYAPGYYWVGVEDGQSHVYEVFPSPVRERDTVMAVMQLLPTRYLGTEQLMDEDFKWSASPHPPTYSPPWPVPRKFSWPGTERTFFGLDNEGMRIYVGSSAAPLQRCAGDELELLGICGVKKEKVRTKLMKWTTGKQGWFEANEKSLARVAKLTSRHASKVLSEYGRTRPWCKEAIEFQQKRFREERALTKETA